MRATLLLVLFAALIATAVPAHAGDEPTPAELATMILEGNDAEHALVARWLETADRTELKAVFRALRAARQRPAVPRVPPGFAPAVPPDLGRPAGLEGTLINAEMKVLDVPVGSVQTLLGAHRPTPERNAVAVPAKDAAALLDAVEKRADVKVVTAPRIMVHDGQKANVSVLNEVSYVQDFDVQATKDGGIAEPIVQTIQEGTLIDFTPSLDEPRTSIRLDYAGTFATVQRPIPSKEVELPGMGPAKVTIQLPEVRVRRVRTAVTVPDGGWVLIGGGVVLEPKKGEEVERVTLVHLKAH